MLPSVVLFLAALAPSFTQASAVKYGCHNDACLKAVLGTHNKPCKAQCKSFLQITVTPRAATVYKTVTAFVTTTSTVPVTATETTFATTTQTQSVVETDVKSITITTTDHETATVTEDVFITSTTGVLPANGPFKRDISTSSNPFLCVDLDLVEKRAVAVAGGARAETSRPTRIPKTASACHNTAAFSSACSCIGVTATTSTLRKATVVSTVTKSVTRAKDVSTTVNTRTVTSTAKTDTVTTTYTTDTVTTTVSTVEVDVVDATQTVLATSVVQVPPNPVQTVYLRAVGSNDPRLASSAGIGFTELESFRGSNYVYYMDFTPNVASSQLFGVNAITGELTAINGPGIAAGEGVYYSTFGGAASASYVNICPADFASSQGGQAAVCKIAAGNGYEYLQCKWGDSQLADFWTCAGRLNFVRPGYDFSHSCVDSSTSYKVPLIQVIRA